jgi:hypothetical protein
MYYRDDLSSIYSLFVLQAGMFGGPGAQGEGGPGNAFQEDESWKRHLEPVTPTYWLVAVRQNGNFELYSMPDFTLRCSTGFSQFF